MMLGNCARALSDITIISVIINNEMNFMEIPSDGSGYKTVLYLSISFFILFLKWSSVALDHNF